MDGHERKDVVKYREGWSKRMINYKKKMDEWTGEEMDMLMEDKVEVRGNKHVHVTHDESTFYSNDGREEFWVEEGDNWIRKKGPGGSIMIGDFLCPCHGPMKVTGQQARENGLT